MVAYTTTYNLKKPTVADDEDVWGGYLNDSMDIIDDVLDGTVPVTGIDINSGTLDNVVIGGSTANTGTFTVLSATTSLGVTGNITVSGTVDGVDIATRDGVLTTTTTTANAALPKAGGTMTGAITFAAGQSFDGRDVSADGAKLDGIESGATADQTKADIDALGIAASTAATLATARNIALTGAVTGNVNFDGSGNVSITTTATSDPTLTLSGDVSGTATFTNLGNATLTATVADDSHNHVISNVDGLQTALDGKLSTSGTAANSQLLDSLDSSQFLRSDTSDTFTTLSGTTLNLGSQVQLSESAERADLLQISSTTSGWGGLQIRNSSNEGRWSFMTDGATAGIYDDENNDWHIQMAENAGVTLYHNGVANFTTGASNLEMARNLDLNNYDIYGVDQIFHHGDTNTYMQFHAADQWRVVTGGAERLEVNNTRTYIDRLFVDAGVVEDYEALSGTSPTCNVNNGGAFSLTMTGNTTFTFTAPWDTANSTGFVLELTGNGGTVTWPSSVDWAGGTAPDAPASGETDIYVFWTRDGGTTWYGVQSIDAAA